MQNDFKPPLINLCLLSAPAVLIFLFLTQSLEIGSKEGNWWSPYLGPYTIEDFGVFLMMVVAFYVLLEWSLSALKEHTSKVLFLWFVLGTLSSMIFKAIFFIDMSSIVRSDAANAFYGAAYGHPFLTFIFQVHERWLDLVSHALHNMPGKILFYHALWFISPDPQLQGYLIILVSSLGCYLCYGIVYNLFKNQQAAFYAFALYLVIPSRLFQSPQLNAVAPLTILALLYLFSLYLEPRQTYNTIVTPIWGRVLLFFESHKSRYLVLMGVVLFIVFLFEPTPLAMGILFLSLILEYSLKNKINSLQIFYIFALPVIGFLSVYLLLIYIFDFNAFRTFFFILQDAVHFNEQAQRHYHIWVFENVIDFVSTTGIASIVILLLASWDAVGDFVKKFKNSQSWESVPTSSFYTLTFVFTFVLIDLLGVNRGETVRLWIFFTPFVHMAAAEYLARRLDVSAFKIVFFSMLLECSVGNAMIGYILV